MSEQAKGHPPTYDELWQACVTLENREHKLKQTVAIQAAEIDEMERVIAYVEQEYSGSYGDWLAALEGESDE